MACRYARTHTQVHLRQEDHPRAAVHRALHPRPDRTEGRHGPCSMPPVAPPGMPRHTVACPLVPPAPSVPGPCGWQVGTRRGSAAGRARASWTWCRGQGGSTRGGAPGWAPSGCPLPLAPILMSPVPLHPHAIPMPSPASGARCPGGCLQGGARAEGKSCKAPGDCGEDLGAKEAEGVGRGTRGHAR